MGNQMSSSQGHTSFKWASAKQQPESRAAVAPRGSFAAPCPPSLTGGESLPELGGAKIDWFTATFKPSPDEHLGATAHDWFNSWLSKGIGGEDSNGLFGYAHGVRFFMVRGGQPVYIGRIDYGGDHHDGRARIELTGTGCSLVASWGAVVGVLTDLDEVKLTRVDLAVDCLNGEFGVEDAVDWYQSGDFNAGGRMPRHSLVGDWLAPKHGRTLEVGRRENGKMLRCYEKGRQLGDQASPWTRFEVEIRNNDRDIPLDILTKPDSYFVGAYKCLERLLDAAAERIKTHQKEGEISLETLSEYARSAYGKLFHVLRASLTADEVIDSLSRSGFPKRLERAALYEFSKWSPTDQHH
jgi:phage replication initiation protein